MLMMSSGLAWGLLVSPSVESKAERAGSSGLLPSPEVAEVLSWRLGSLGWATWGDLRLMSLSLAPVFWCGLMLESLVLLACCCLRLRMMLAGGGVEGVPLRGCLDEALVGWLGMQCCCC